MKSKNTHIFYIIVEYNNLSIYYNLNIYIVYWRTVHILWAIWMYCNWCKINTTTYRFPFIHESLWFTRWATRRHTNIFTYHLLCQGHTVSFSETGRHVWRETAAKAGGGASRIKTHWMASVHEYRHINCQYVWRPWLTACGLWGELQQFRRISDGGENNFWCQ